ncbi:MAG: hypothetical protein PHY48_10345 [Candidatus Cloacimonetes bacterium]|nr:hypothetical protein [Candidatus Cloacimonadota bacterium]
MDRGGKLRFATASGRCYLGSSAASANSEIGSPEISSPMHSFKYIGFQAEDRRLRQKATALLLPD